MSVQSNDHDRRQFLKVLAGSLGAMALGGTAWALARVRSREQVSVSAPDTTTTTGTPTTSSTPPTSTTSTTSPTTTTSLATPGISIEVICREAWGARPATGPFTLHQIERITVHHTGALIEDNAESPQFTRRHQQYHQGSELGWPDIAYHYLIDSHGYVYEGRPWDAVGDTRTSYDPTGHLLIAAKGNFEIQTPTEAQLETLYDVLAWAAEHFGIEPAEIKGHRDYASTACPGQSLYALLESEEIADQVRMRMSTSTVDIAELCGDEGFDLVAAIEAGSA